MFKLTNKQRQEVILTLEEMYKNYLNQKAELKKLKEWDETFENIFASTGNKILNLIDKIKNNKEFEFSKNFYHTALIWEIVSTQNKDDLEYINTKVGFGFNGKDPENNNLN